MDDDGSQSVSLPEFSKACRDFKVGISDENVPNLFKLFDANGDGIMNYAEFLAVVREPLSSERREVVEEVFKFIDEDGSGQVDIEEIKAKYDVQKHPDVVQCKRTAEVVLNDFIETLEAHHNVTHGHEAQGLVCVDEFLDYYTNVSAQIESDAEFESLLKFTWGMKAGQFNGAQNQIN